MNQIIKRGSYMLFKNFLIGLFVLLMSFSVSASEIIGKVDMQILFKDLKQIAKFKSNIEEKQADYQKLLEKKEQEMAQAREKNKSPEQIQALITKAEEELLPKQQEMMELQMAFEKNLKFEIDSMSKKIAEEYGLELVVNKEVIFFGGMDITSILIERINES